jgi:hypothetical protein
MSAHPAVKDGVLYTGAAALDESTGATIWRVDPLLGLFPTAVAVDGGLVFTGGTLAAFPVSCSNPCSPLWYGWFGGGGQPAVSNGIIFIDAGYVNWFNTYPTACAQPCLPSSQTWTDSGNRNTVPAIVNDTVFTVDGNGSLVAYDKACPGSCSLKWKQSLGGYVSSPSIANDVLYVGGDNAGGYLLAVDPDTGNQLARIPTAGNTSSPAIAGGRVFASAFSFSAGGAVVAFSVPGALDETPPEITVPADITVNATSPAGATVEFTVTATDENPANPAVTCTPFSGSVFPIGNTTVDCDATDAAGNAATASFNITVKGASGQLADLLEAVNGVGPGTSLADKVAQMQAALAAGDTGYTCSLLNAFINQIRAQLGRSIADSTASTLIAHATRIKTVLDC